MSLYSPMALYVCAEADAIAVAHATVRIEYLANRSVLLIETAESEFEKRGQCRIRRFALSTEFGLKPAL
jgi:hypothetical protein